MTYSIKLRNVLFAIVLSLIVTVPLFAQAQYTQPNADQRAGLAASTKVGEDSLGSIIVSVTAWLAGLLAVLAILVIVVAGILYITSGGDEGRISTAKTWLTYAIIGLIVALLAWVIVSTVAGALDAG